MSSSTFSLAVHCVSFGSIEVSIVRELLTHSVGNSVFIKYICIYSHAAANLANWVAHDQIGRASGCADGTGFENNHRTSLVLWLLGNVYLRRCSLSLSDADMGH